MLRVRAVSPDDSPLVVEVFGLGAGEITLSGYVVPVAGVWQKLPAARRRGLTAVVVPRGNEDQLDTRLGGGVARELTVRPVRRVDEFLEVVLRPAEAACSLAVESAASLRAALAAGVPE